MLDAIVGAVIMVVATTSLLYSLEVAQQAFDQAGQYPLNKDEREELSCCGFVGDAAEKFWQENINKAPKEVGLNE